MFCYYCMEPMAEGSQTCPSCGRPLYESEALHHLKPGTKLCGKYLVGQVLGEGGFGITYIGRDLDLDIKVAIKEYYPKGFATRNSAADEGVTLTSKSSDDVYTKGRKSFLKEARTLAKFSREPNIVNVRDFFEANNTAYFVMDYLSGTNLKKYIEENGTLEPQRAVEWLIPIMKVLKKVHDNGMIHRDISPDNIIVEDGQLILIDFGASREVDTDKSLSVIHKPGYAPGEQQYSRGNQGPWTDVYAMCATIYKCITGEKPPEASERIFEDNLVPPSQMGVDIPPFLEAALLKGLENRYQERQQSMDQLIAELTGQKPVNDEINDIPSEDSTHSVRINAQTSDAVEEEEKTVYESGYVPDKTVHRANMSKTLTAVEQDEAVTVCETKPFDKDDASSVKLTLEKKTPPKKKDPPQRETPTKKKANPPQNDEVTVPMPGKAPKNKAQQPAPDVKAAQNDSEGLKKKILLAGGAALVVCVLIIIFVASLGGGNKNVPSNQDVLSDIKNSGLISGMIVSFEVEGSYTGANGSEYTAVCSVEEAAVNSGAKAHLYSINVVYDLSGSKWECRSVNVVSS